MRRPSTCRLDHPRPRPRPSSLAGHRPVSLPMLALCVSVGRRCRASRSVCRCLSRICSTASLAYRRGAKWTYGGRAADGPRSRPRVLMVARATARDAKARCALPTSFRPVGRAWKVAHGSSGRSVQVGGEEWLLMGGHVSDGMCVEKQLRAVDYEWLF